MKFSEIFCIHESWCNLFPYSFSTRTLTGHPTTHSAFFIPFFIFGDDHLRGWSVSAHTGHMSTPCAFLIPFFLYNMNSSMLIGWTDSNLFPKSLPTRTLAGHPTTHSTFFIPFLFLRDHESFCGSMFTHAAHMSTFCTIFIPFFLNYVQLLFSIFIWWYLVRCYWRCMMVPMGSRWSLMVPMGSRSSLMMLMGSH